MFFEPAFLSVVVFLGSFDFYFHAAVKGIIADFFNIMRQCYC